MASYADSKTQEATATSSSEYEPLPSGSKAPLLAEGAVLTQAEKRLVDAVGGVLGKLPWVKHEGEADLEAESSDDKDVLRHRYKSWENNRESNVVLALICGLIGAGRPQPTTCERFLLLLLYAACSFLAFCVTAESGTAACEASWVTQCVPPELGGACTSQCAAPEVLAMTPAWVSYRSALASSMFHHVDFNAASWEDESKAAAAWTPCMLPLCVGSGTDNACQFEQSQLYCDPGGRDGRNAMCECSGKHEFFRFKLGISFGFLLIIKVFYAPVRKVFLAEFESSSDFRLRVKNATVATAAVGFSGRVFWLFWARVEKEARADLMPLFFAKWLATFLVLGVLEAAKGFLLGHVIGYYFVRPKCPARMWALWQVFFS